MLKTAGNDKARINKQRVGSVVSDNTRLMKVRKTEFNSHNNVIVELRNVSNFEKLNLVEKRNTTWQQHRILIHIV